MCKTSYTSTDTLADSVNARIRQMDHRDRARLILQKYGKQIHPLMRPHPLMKYAVMVPGLCLFGLSYLVHEVWVLTPLNKMWWFIAWGIGGLLTNWCTAGLHEIGHNCATRNLVFREFLGSLANAPLCIPVYASFRRYHKEHHLFLNTKDDPDMPTDFEKKMFTSAVGKFLWLLAMPATYCFRPMLVNPLPISIYEVNNFFFCLAAVLLLMYFGGIFYPLFCAFSTILGLSIHPNGAAHVLAEHYNFFFPNKEHHQTYCYYGPLNWFLFNLGYHAQHHDFPNIPGFYLPKVKEIASDFYDDIPVHKSMPKLMFDFVISPNCGLNARLDTSQNKKKLI